jgi:hypothetical protein
LKSKRLLNTLLSILLVIMLLIIIAHKLEQDKLFVKLEEEHVYLVQRVDDLRVKTADALVVQENINASLEAMGEVQVDMEWLYWMESNWDLVKPLGHGK